MDSSVIVIGALSQLNDDLRDNDAFAGYNDDEDGTSQLLAQLWDVYLAYDPNFRSEHPQELVACWYLSFFADCNE